MTREDQLDRMARSNVADALRDGPRLTTDYHTWVVARDPEYGRVLVGGLGCLGVGTLWVEEAEHHRNMVGYGDAPTRPSDGQFKSLEEAIGDLAELVRWLKTGEEGKE